MTPLTEEKRSLIILAKERGETEAEIAKWLGIRISSVCKIWKLYKDTGSYSHRPYKGRKAKISSENWRAVEVKLRKRNTTLGAIITRSEKRNKKKPAEL